MLNEVKYLAIAREILRCAQNDIVHHLTYDKALCTALQMPNFHRLFLPLLYFRRYSSLNLHRYHHLARRLGL
jgi:hypothetical protein